MNNRVDIMVDIETLGTTSDSTIFQLSAVAFDIRTGKTGGTFSEIADIEMNNDIVATGGTIKWWLKTNKELLKKLLVEENDGKSSTMVLYDFYEWLVKLQDIHGKKNVYMWGNGILFDNKMIETQFKNIGLDYPIFYRNDRDVRTIVELASEKTGTPELELKKAYQSEDFVAHDAFNDVMFQILLVHKCYEILMG